MWKRLLIGLSLLLAVMGMLACTGVSKTGSVATVEPATTPIPVPFQEAVEMQVLQAAEPLPDGPVSGLIGAYSIASAGDRQLLVCDVNDLTVACRRYSVTLEGTAPGLVRVSGEIRNGQLVVSKAETSAWDEAGQRSEAAAKLNETVALLDRYDWSLLAKPEYTEVSAWFRPSAAQLTEGGLSLYGYDTAHGWLIWRNQGTEMPKPAREVFRYPVIYVITDPSGKQPTQSIVTIEGRVEE